MDDVIRVQTTYPTPWILKVFNSLPGRPASICLGLLLVLLTCFFVGRSFSNAQVESNELDFRMAIFHFFFTIAIAFVYVHLLKSMENTRQQLMPLISSAHYESPVPTGAGKYLNWSPIVGGLTIITFTILATNLSSDFANPWDWRQNSYDTIWIRIMALCFSGLGGGFLALLITGSLRLSRLSEGISHVDILDLQLYQSLTRQGLTNCLLVLASTSLLSVFMLEPKLEWKMLQLTIIFAICGFMVLMLPLQGIRRKIKSAKEQELEWCRQAYITARDHLKKGTSGKQSIAEIRAYQTEIEDVANWPFDSSTVTRFVLYLLIPTGSIFGGVIVEWGVEILFQ